MLSNIETVLEDDHSHGTDTHCNEDLEHEWSMEEYTTCTIALNPFSTR